MKKIIIFLTLAVFVTSCSKNSSTSSNNSNNSSIANTTKAGSLARFAVIDNYLYALNNTNLEVFNIANPAQISKVNSINVGQVSETIYPFRNKLYIASNSGMAVYSLANPTNPDYVGYVSHVTGCDPVIANDKIACLTIHGGTTCNNNNMNVMEIYNIQNSEMNPTLISTTQMGSPLGLGFLNDNTVAVCDRQNGLTVFDITNPDQPKQLSVINDEEYMDVIPYGNNMVCMLYNGLAYFDITNPQSIKQVSTLK